MIHQCDQMKRLLEQRKNEGHMIGSQEEICGASGNSSVEPLLKPKVTPAVQGGVENCLSTEGIKGKRQASNPKLAVPTQYLVTSMTEKKREKKKC